MSVTYALLNDRIQARAALDELEQIKTPVGINIRVRDHAPHVDELTIPESGLLKGIGQGAVFGSLGSAVVVAGLSLLGVITGPILPPVLVAFFLGGTYGTMVGAVAGTSCPDNALERLDKQKGKDGVIVTIHTRDPDAAEDVHRILNAHGAIEARPELI